MQSGSSHRNNQGSQAGLRSVRIKHLIGDLLPFIVFFLFSFAWFALAADYVLFFQEKSSLFIFPELVSATFSKPGGFLVSISEMLTSFFYYPVAGSLILSGMITGIIFTLSRSLMHLSGRNEKIIPFIAGLLLFFLHTDYRFMLYNTTGILFQVLAFLVTIRMSRVMKGFMPLIIFPVLYFLTGAFSFAWLLMVIINALLAVTGKKLLIPALLLLPAFILTLSQYLFFSSIESLAIYPVSFPENQLHRYAIILVGALIIMIPLIAKARFPLTQSVSISYSTERITRSAVIILILGLIGVSTYNKKNDHYFRSEKMFYEGRLDRLIDFNTDYPSGNILTLFLNNIALAESGILNDKLFSFPQSRTGETLFLKWEMITEKLKRGGYFYYAVGMINEAHRWAFENMVMKGHTPEGLKLLARTELINGHYDMAAKFISLLGKTIFYRKEAKHLAGYLNNDEALMNDPDLGQKRKMSVRSGFFTMTDNPEINIERILLGDSLNREAFDYKVAWMMLNKDYKGLERVLTKFGKLGYKAFPVHVEEVIMMIALSNNDTMPETGGLKVRNETVVRWEQFLSVFQQYASNPRTAEPALKKQFGNTFWYWAFYK